jgi:NADH-quinone oxidoreductase subunit H
MCEQGTGGAFCWLHGLLGDLLNTPQSLEWAAFALAGLVLAFVVVNVLLMAATGYTWFERRALGRFQARLGPNRWGPFGMFQPIADGIKLLTKEDVVPADADRWVFNAAPIALMAPTILVVAVIPLEADSFLGSLNIGVLFLIGVTSVNTIAIFMGGWASRNKYAMFGAMRGVAMLISYEVPMALALTGVVVLAGSMSLVGIVEAQGVPYLLVQPLGFFVFMTAAAAEMSRAPFDMIEAESELGGGYVTEYAGIKFAILQLAEFMAPLATAAVATVLFLGGTRGFDPIPGPVWFVAKAFALVFLMLWIRATWPRLRVDQIMGFAWKALLPLALVNMFVVAIELVVLQDSESGAITSGDLWTMAAVNWVIAVAAIFVTANVLGQRRLRPETPVPSPLANMTAEAD